MEGANQKSPSCSLPSALLQWEAQGSTRPAITSSTTTCVLLSLEAAISSVCSHLRAGRPHATLSSSLAKPTGLYIAHRFLGGTLGYQNFEVSEDVLPLSVGSTFPLSLEPCTPRVGAAPGARMQALVGADLNPERAPVKSSHTRLGSQQRVCR